MKKKIASLMLFLTLTATLAGVVSAAVHNPKTSQCHDESGKFIESKDCDPTSCGCLFHQIEEFIIGLFE